MPKAKTGNFTLRKIAQAVPGHQAAHRFTALQRSGQYSELRFIRRGKNSFDIVGYRWPDKGTRRKLNIGRARQNPLARMVETIEKAGGTAYSRYGQLTTRHQNPGGYIDPAQLERLRREWSQVKTFPLQKLKKVRLMFAGLSDEAIDQLIHAEIKFLSKLAVNEAGRRKSRTKNPTPRKGATPNQVLFGMRGRTLVGWINAETPKRYQITYKVGAQTRTVWRAKNRVKFQRSGKYGKLTKRPNNCPTEANPSSAPLIAAAKLSEVFHGAPPRHVRKVNITWPTGALMKVGDCAQLDYISDKWDGKWRQYYHKFTRPAEVYADTRLQRDGTNLLIIRGRFRIKPQGITG